MSSIEKLSKDITIIIISHRLSTIQSCDRLISIKEGEIIKEGSPKEVLENLKIN